jgi:hypothetical protein
MKLKKIIMRVKSIQAFIFYLLYNFEIKINMF